MNFVFGLRIKHLLIGFQFIYTDRNSLNEFDAILVTKALEYLPEGEIYDIARYYTLWISYNPDIYAHKFTIHEHIAFVVCLTEKIMAKKLRPEKAIKVILHEVAHCMDGSLSEEEADQQAEEWFLTGYSY